MDPKQYEKKEEAEESEYYSPHGSDLTESELEDIRKRFLGKLHGCPVYTVDGEYIRNYIYVDFTTGGNSARYRFVPDGEIWAEQISQPLDALADIAHEFVEFYDMKSNKASYDDAHQIACRFERVIRDKIKTGKIKITNLSQIVPYLNQLLFFRKNKMHKAYTDLSGLPHTTQQNKFAFAPNANVQMGGGQL